MRAWEWASSLAGGLGRPSGTDKWEVAMAPVELEEIREALKDLPFWRDRRPLQYGRLVGKESILVASKIIEG